MILRMNSKFSSYAKNCETHINYFKIFLLTSCRFPTVSPLQYHYMNYSPKFSYVCLSLRVLASTSCALPTYSTEQFLFYFVRQNPYIASGRLEKQHTPPGICPQSQLRPYASEFLASY